MAKGHPINLFHTFRFYLNGRDADIGLTYAKHTPAGLQLGKAHAHGEPSVMASFAEDPPNHLRIILVPRDGGFPRRVITYDLGRMGQHLAVDLDATNNSVAIDAVNFPDAKLICFKDVQQAEGHEDPGSDHE
jgi:hypothetical protein